MRDKRVKQVIDTGLSSLRMSEQEMTRLTLSAQGGKKVKKKLSVAFVLILMLIIISSIALAIGFGWTQAPYFLKKEFQNGSFAQWSAEEQMKLLDSLVEDKHIAQTEEYLRLKSPNIDAEERSALVKRMLSDWLSQPEEHISFQTIMAKIWGDFRAWTVEQKAWYTNTLIEAGVQSADMEKFVFPDEGAVSQEAAIRLARSAASVMLDVPLDELKNGEAYASYVIFPKPIEANGEKIYTTDNMPPVWNVELNWGQAGDLHTLIYIEVDPQTGNPSWQSFSLKIRAKAYGYQDWPEIALKTEDFITQQAYLPLMSWSHQARSDWSTEIRPLVINAAKQENIDQLTLAYSRYVYGLPSADAIAEAAAIATSRQVVLDNHTITDEALNTYDQVYALYDITDDAPKWRIHFTASGKNMDVLTNQHPEAFVRYRVELDANTGQVISHEAFNVSDDEGLDAIVRML